MCGSPPDAPKLPDYPGLTPEEQSILQKQGLSLDQFNKLISGTGDQLQQNQQLLQGISGLYNPDGSVNQDRLASLQQRTQQALQTQGQVGQSALDYLGSLYGQGGVAQQQTQAYQNALKGDVPANQQLEFSAGQNFQALKEQAAQQGIIIQGDDWNSATSESTAGQKLLQNFQQNYNIQNQNYKLGYLNTAGQNMAQLAGTGATTAQTGTNLTGNATNAPIGYVGQSIAQGPSALAPLLQQYQQGLSQYYQPYYMQQIGPYQQQMAQSQANYQAGLNQYNASQNQAMGWANFGLNAIGTAAGAAKAFSGPAAAAA